MRPRRRRRIGSERGAELIEFAFVLPLLLFVVLGIIDFGFLFRDYETLVNAAREGARLATLADDYTDGDIQTRVIDYGASSGLTRASIAASVADATIDLGGGTTVSGRKVTATYPHGFQFIGPIASFFGGSFGTVTLTATATMRTEIPAP